MSSFWANRYKVARHGRSRCLALHKQEIEEDPQCERRIHDLTGKRMLCHCRKNQSCLGNNLIQLYHRVYPAAYDRIVTDRAPTSAELNALAEARNECSDSEESQLDAEIACAPQGWRGNHKQLMVGAGYTEREVCDRQGLSSPGRWSQEDRLYPSSSLWLQIQRMFSRDHDVQQGMGLSGILRTEESYLLTFGCFTAFFLQLVIRRSRCASSLSESALAREQSFPDVLSIALFRCQDEDCAGSQYHRQSRQWITVKQAHGESLFSVCFAQGIQRAIRAHRNQTRSQMVTERNQCRERQASER